jgi:Zn-dependent peptidase ImmA (M78 family)
MSGSQPAPSVLAELRALVPRRHLSPNEVRQLAEFQANRLIELARVTEPPFPHEFIMRLPRVQVLMERRTPVSASTHWNGRVWVVVVNGAEGPLRRRYSLAHELKHIIDHPFRFSLYRDQGGMSADLQAEWSAEFFAACLLMPKAWIRLLWDDGCRTVESIADHLNVSVRAAENRLCQLGLPIRHQHTVEIAV